MLSDPLLDEFCRATPLRSVLLREAWPYLTTESKLEIIRATARSGLPKGIFDLAIADNASIVRGFAARNYSFQRPYFVRDGEKVPNVLGKSITAEERARTNSVEKDPSAFVRAAAEVGGNSGLVFLEEDPQLTRLIRIRDLDRSDGKNLAIFIEKGLSRDGVSLSEIRECLMEYFASEAFKSDLEGREPRGIFEERPSAGWNRLWGLAATVPEGISSVLATHLPYESKGWKVSQTLLHALPKSVKETVVFGDSAPAEEMRQTLLKSPKEYDPDLVHSASRYYSFVVDEGGGPIPPDERLEMELESTPYRQDAVFRSVKRLRNTALEQQNAVTTLLQNMLVLSSAMRGLKTQLIYLYVGIFISMGVLFFAHSLAR